MTKTDSCLDVNVAIEKQTAQYRLNLYWCRQRIIDCVRSIHSYYDILASKGVDLDKYCSEEISPRNSLVVSVYTYKSLYFMSSYPDAKSSNDASLTLTTLNKLNNKLSSELANLRQ